MPPPVPFYSQVGFSSPIRTKALYITYMVEHHKMLLQLYVCICYYIKAIHLIVEVGEHR